MRLNWWMICLGASAWLALPAANVQAQAARPNIIHIFADDLGAGSVGFNGQSQIATPNLDAIANAGMRFNNAYAAPVCAPSRAMLLTGMHQGHASIDGNDGLQTGFRAEDVMTPAVLAPAGYTSAIFGKWGFGADGVRNLTGSDPPPAINLPESLPTNHGFDEFYGYLNHGAAHDYFYDWMWQDDAGAPHGVSTVANDGGPGGSPEYTHDLFADKSEAFVAAHAGSGSPFYMQVSYAIPHFDIDAIASAPGGFGMYAGLPWTEKQKAYAAMITRMDASIGALIDRLDDPNADGSNSDSILNDTIVLFTSDNGPTTADESPIEFFDASGIYRGGKFELYEGGIHMPALAYWKGTIEPGSESDYRTDLADFMATAADLAGVEAPVGIDGTSIAPTLTGQGRQRERDYLVFEHQGAHGGDADPRIGRWAVIRQDGMKLIQYDNGTQVLFNLNTDPDESSPLSLGLPTNAAIAAELEAAAIAEGALRGVVEYRAYTGPNGGNLQDAANWDGISRPHGYWSAAVVNSEATPAIAHVTEDVTTLGIEVRGQTAPQVVDVHSGRTLSGRNEVRIGANGRLDLSGGTLATNRWVNVRDEGELRGEGTVVGDIYNEGTLSPGRPNDPEDWPLAAPPALPPSTLNTGVIAAAIFNFSGVQDDVPLFSTAAQSPYVEVSHGLDFGPGVGPRLGNGGTDEGNEFNVAGHTATSLQAAINADDYISFTVDPVEGAGIIPTSVNFQLWRNGGAAARNFAVLSSIDGFTSTAPLAQATYTDTGNEHVLTASLPSIEALAEPVEFRLYAWGATAETGNTHFNAASVNARFVAVPTLKFDFTGVQDNAPLTALRRQHASLALAAGLDFGPGIAAAGTGNAGDEFHVAGFSTGSTLGSAIDGDDYLSFSVQPITGMAMLPDSVSFTLWRNASESADEYAILSSIGGFTPDEKLVQAKLTSVGAGNQQVVTGGFVNAQPITDEVEFRLYGWNAATSLDSTHLVAASMRARFASLPGSAIDPTGSLVVQGDLYHLEGGVIAVDLGGHAVGVDYDTLEVLGKIELEGDLVASLADVGGSPFAPALGDSFDILTAAQGITGQFAEVVLPLLSMGLDWRVDYLNNAIALTVVATADFNRDGLIDAADYIVWRKNGGSPEQYDLWRANFGATAGSGSGLHLDPSGSANVPEPAAALLLLFGTSVACCRRRGM
jgi:arylsulfatase A-like enzyme